MVVQFTLFSTYGGCVCTKYYDIPIVTFGTHGYC